MRAAGIALGPQCPLPGPAPVTPALALPSPAREELCQWMSSQAGALDRFTCSLWAWAVPASADLEGGRGYLLAACRCWQAVRWGRRAVSSASAGRGLFRGTDQFPRLWQMLLGSQKARGLNPTPALNPVTQEQL